MRRLHRTNDEAKQALGRHVAEGLVGAANVTKLAGKGLKTFDGFRLVDIDRRHGPAATEPG